MTNVIRSAPACQSKFFSETLGRAESRRYGANGSSVIPGIGESIIGQGII